RTESSSLTEGQPGALEDGRQPQNF
ncbi:MAG: hypothetical protein QOJ70_2894, partial [Acidobacteriota bacterium]|nr:hypothetical protein [Acidobacteriota bacterium]